MYILYLEHTKEKRNYVIAVSKRVEALKRKAGEYQGLLTGKEQVFWETDFFGVLWAEFYSAAPSLFTISEVDEVE